MATRYLDHGAYGDCTVDSAHWSATTTTLTVTAGATITGVLNVGSVLSGGGLSAGTYISAFVSGTQGGVGTYTIVNNTVTIASPGAALVGKFANPLNVPLSTQWGIPQEGDGTASTPAAASAIASLLINDVAAAGNTVVIMGVTLTAVASGATATQFNVGGTTTAQADNLATAFNAATGTVNAGTSAATPALRNMVYARGPALGAPANTVQIMTRVGSASLNHAGNSNVAISTAGWASAPTITQFAGGSGGCWGYLFNSFTIWPTAVAAAAYGFLCATLSYGGSVAAGDVVNVRAGKTIYLPNSTSLSFVQSAMGSATAPVLVLVDNSTVWSDGANPVLKITQLTNNNNGYGFTPNNAGFVHFKGVEYSGGTKNFILEGTGSGANISVVTIRFGPVVTYENIDLFCTGTSLCSATNATGTSGINSSNFINCKFTWPAQQAGVPVVVAGVASSCSVNFIRCTFVQTAPSGIQNLVIGTYSPGGGNCRFNFDSCTFSGYVVGSILHAAQSFTATQNCWFSNCDFGNVTKTGPFNGAGITLTGLGERGTYASSSYGNRDWLMDTPNGFCAWNSTQSYPTLNAKLLDGTTPWSIRVIPSTLAANVNKLAPFDTPRIAKINSLADGVRTLTVELAIDKSLTWTKQDVSLLVEYIDTSNVKQVVRTYDPLAGALTASTASWSSNAVDPFDSVTRVLFNDGGNIYHNRYKFSVTTPTAIKSGTEIACYLLVHTNVSNSTQSVFVDPEITVV